MQNILSPIGGGGNHKVNCTQLTTKLKTLSNPKIHKTLDNLLIMLLDLSAIDTCFY